MEKIKLSFIEFKKKLAMYPLSLGIVFLYTIFLALFLDSTFINVFIASITITSVLATTYMLIIESNSQSIKDDIVAKIVILLISFIIGGISYFIEANDISNYFSLYYYLACLLIFIIGILGFIYTKYVDSKDDLYVYLKNVLYSIIGESFKYFVIVMGSTFIYVLCSLLVYEFDDLIIRIILLISGLYYAPSVIFSFSEKTESKFLDIVFSKIGSILMTVSFVIIYAYIFKLIFASTLLEHEIFYILGLLFIFSVPVWIVNKTLVNNKYITAIPYTFIPFIVLQAVAMFIRIFEYGVTELRYFGIVFIILEILFLVVYKFRIDVKKILVIISGIFAISLICPYINAVALSDYSQYCRLEKLYNQNNKDERDLREISRIYERFDEKFSNGPNHDYIVKKFSKEELKEIVEIYNKYSYYFDYGFEDSDKEDEIRYFEYTTKLELVDISEYNKIEKIRSSSENEIIYFGNYKFNLSNLVDEILNGKTESKNIYIVDEDKAIIAETVYVNYNLTKKKVDFLKVDGYLLTK